MILTRETEVLGDKPLSYSNLTWSWLGWKPSLCGQKPETNLMNHGAGRIMLNARNQWTKKISLTL
jgi:hypothetical protein